MRLDSRLVARSMISIVACSLATAHLIWPTLSIDAVTLGLAAIAVIPWLETLFKSVEFPGGFKVEYRELQDAERRAEDAGVLPEPAATAADHTYTFQMVARHDPVLALAGMRIELEVRLKKLAELAGTGTRMQGLTRVLSELTKHEMLSLPETHLIKELIGILNAAVHGELRNQLAADWALDVGPRVLAGLDEHLSSGSKQVAAG